MTNVVTHVSLVKFIYIQLLLWSQRSTIGP